MNTARWDELETLFGQALALPPDERPAFLDRACRGDAELRAELDSLLAHYEEAPGYFDRLVEVLPAPALPLGPDPARTRDDPHALTGSLVSHYRVLEPLGEGGMGVVYRAEDTRLKRPVALKFLPPHLSADAGARQRFVQEAQAASALDHANICTIYEIGETSDGRTFIAMACYEGETLKKKIERGPLAIEQALDYAAQAARGLAKAHAAGIVHRDVKPANVMVTDDGVVKMLDFGLAKVADVHLTRTGTTMGTVAYMSPEQARGQDVDHRADLWSLGVVLYEMLAGERPFRGDYPEAALYNVQHQDPTPLREVAPQTPEALEHVVAMCLEKDRDLRYRAMADLLADLEVLTGGAAPGVSASLRAARRRRIRLPRRAVLAGAAVATALALLLAIPSVRQAVLRGVGFGAAPMHLAVLPFTSPDADSSYRAFDEGLHLAMTNTLTQMKPYAGAPLRIVPASELGAVTTAAEARQRFGVRHVVMGHVLHEGEAVRLDLSLIDAERLDQVRATTVTAAAGEVASMQAGLVSALADLLQIALTPQARRALTAGGTADSRAYAFYLEGTAFLDRLDKPENIDTAIRFFDYALEEDSRYALAHAGLGRAFVQKYNQTADSSWIARAERHSRRALALDDRLAEAHTTLGMLHLSTGAYEQAVGAYRLALALDAPTPDAYIGLADAQEKLQRLLEAEATYLRGIDRYPGYNRLHNKLGGFYFRNKRYAEAAAQYHQVITLAPDNVWGYNNLGVAYLQQNKLDEARRWLERSLEVRPYASAYANLGLIAIRQKRYTDGARRYEEALALDSTKYNLWGNLARAYRRLPQHEEKIRMAYLRAIEQAEASYRINPNDASLSRSLAAYLADLGNLYFEMKRFAEAAEAYQQALTYDPHDDRLWSGLAHAYERLPEEGTRIAEAYRHAVQEAETKRRDAPDDADVLARLAGYYVSLKQTTQARSVLAEALTAHPDDAALMVEAARLYEKLTEREAALTWIEKALQHGYPLADVKQDSTFQRLRADPRFERLRPKPQD